MATKCGNHPYHTNRARQRGFPSHTNPKRQRGALPAPPACESADAKLAVYAPHPNDLHYRQNSELIPRVFSACGQIPGSKDSPAALPVPTISLTRNHHQKPQIVRSRSFTVQSCTTTSLPDTLSRSDGRPGVQKMPA